MSTTSGCPITTGATCPAGYTKTTQTMNPFSSMFGPQSFPTMPGNGMTGFPTMPGPMPGGFHSVCPWKAAQAGCPAFSAFGYPITTAGGFGSTMGHSCPVGYGRAMNNWTYCSIGFRPVHPIELYSLTNPIRSDHEGHRQLWLCYEMKGFMPNEINVTLNKTERSVIVEACHDLKEGKEHSIMRKFCRKFTLPESLAKVDLSKMELRSYLNHYDGLLTIEANLPRLSQDEIDKCPIMSHQTTGQMTSPSFPHPHPGGFAGFNACPVSSVNVKTA